jgi:hypothetical protein
VPLAQMYREARLAGVPLDVHARGVTAAAREAMTVSETTRTAFNAYLAQCTVKEGKLEDILDEQTRLYVRWRRLRLDTMAALPSVQRAPVQDRTDLLEANRELAEEAAMLGSNITPLVPSPLDNAAVILVKVTRTAREVIDKRGVDLRRSDEWNALRPDWEQPGALPIPAMRLFEDWVHDSRAWFKPMGDDDHIWIERETKRMKTLEVRRQSLRLPVSGRRVTTASLTAQEIRDLEHWQRTGEVPPQPSGREPFWMGGGYLRYRRVYYGADALVVAMGPVPPQYNRFQLTA